MRHLGLLPLVLVIVALGYHSLSISVSIDVYFCIGNIKGNVGDIMLHFVSLSRESTPKHLLDDYSFFDVQPSGEFLEMSSILGCALPDEVHKVSLHIHL